MSLRCWRSSSGCCADAASKNALLDTAPALGGMGAALVFHVLCGRNGGTGNELSLDIPAVLRVTVQQMAASLPGLNSRLLQEDAGVITNGDRLWPLALGVLAGLLIFFGVPFKSCAAERWAHWPGSAWPSGHCPRCCWLCPPAISSPRHYLAVGLHSRGGQLYRLYAARRGAAGAAGGAVAVSCRRFSPWYHDWP